MQREIHIYSTVTNDYKRTHIDLLVNGKVSDRIEDSAYNHALLDEFAMNRARNMAVVYGVHMIDVNNLGVLTFDQFNAEQNK